MKKLLFEGDQKIETLDWKERPITGAGVVIITKLEGNLYRTALTINGYVWERMFDGYIYRDLVLGTIDGLYEVAKERKSEVIIFRSDETMEIIKYITENL